MKNIIVTGGAGYIGSHCVIALIQNGFCPIIIDNFSNSYPSVIKKLEIITKKKIIFYKADLRNKKKIKSILNENSCSAVIHCAGFKSLKESLEKPLTYFDNNIVSTLSLLECMKEKKIFKFIFSSSALVYDYAQPLPWNENTKIGNTNNPYGTTKYIIEKILIDLAKSDYRWKIGIARYFNPISNYSTGIIKENPKRDPSNLIPYIIKVAQKKLPFLKIFGRNYPTRDGTCIRDFIHVMDLANGHIAMLKKKKLKKNLNFYNFGTGKGSSVLEVVRAFEKNTGISIPFKFTKKRKGDNAVYFCNPTKAFKELNWKTNYNLDQSVKDIKRAI
jgi:UDP-glucose 4-epimerase